MKISELRDKYVELEALRVERREATHEGRRAVPVARLRELSARYPGALRELERLPLADLVARREELERAAHGLAPEPEWSRAQRLYHAWLAEALRARRATRSREADRPPGEVVDADAERRLGACARELQRPPGGRLGAVIVTRVAEALGLETRACRSLLFPWDG